MFVLKVDKSNIRVLETEPIYGDSKNIYNVVLLFNEDWNGLSKVITFDNGEKSNPILVSDPMRTIVTTSIPWELLTYPGTIRISIAGAKNNLIVLPTQFCVLGKVKQGSTVIYPPDTPNPPPTPTVIDQLIGLISGKGDTLTYKNGLLCLQSGDVILSQVEIQNGSSGGDFPSISSINDVVITDDSFFEKDINQTYHFQDVTISAHSSVARQSDTVPNITFYDDVVQVITSSDSLKIYTIQGEIITFPYALDGSIMPGSIEVAVSGSDGKSAYQIAVENGYTGTEEEWLNSLKGTNGLSAYQVAVESGFTGTEEEWLASLNGADGLSAYDIAVLNGYTGTEEEWLNSLPGKSAYQIAADDGFTGTEEEWLASLKGSKGNKGDQGLSAYDIAKKNGYTGTEEEWLNSLKGAPGNTPIIGENGNWFIGETDTGVAAQGITPSIGENGNWFIGETDTGVNAGGGGADLSNYISKDQLNVISPKNRVISPSDIGETASSVILNGNFELVDGSTVSYTNEVVTSEKTVDTDGNISATITSTSSKSVYNWIPEENKWEQKSSSSYASADDIPTKTSQLINDSDYLSNGIDLRVITGEPSTVITPDQIIENGSYILTGKFTDLLSYNGDSVSIIKEVLENNVISLVIRDSNGETELLWDSATLSWNETSHQSAVYSNDLETAISGIESVPGKSAYEIAVENGYTGTEEEWLASLKGKSAYQIAVENGYTGTEEEWLQSITMDGITIEIVDSLPEIGKDRILYFVPKVDAESNDYHEEWMWINSKWEKIGTTKIDLTDYITNEKLETVLSEKIPTKTSQLENDSGFISEVPAYAAGDGIYISENRINVTVPVKTILTQSEFDALSSKEQNTGLYVIDDGDSGFYKSLTKAEFDALPKEEQNTGLYFITDANISPLGQWVIYSTEETRIGTWIDGKPLYRRAFQFLCPSETNKEIAFTPSLNLEYVISVHSAINGPTGIGRGYGLPYISGSDSLIVYFYDSSIITVISPNLISDFAGHTICTAIEYTKTTDLVPPSAVNPSKIVTVEDKVYNVKLPATVVYASASSIASSAKKLR